MLWEVVWVSLFAFWQLLSPALPQELYLLEIHEQSRVNIGGARDGHGSRLSGTDLRAHGQSGEISVFWPS